MPPRSWRLRGSAAERHFVPSFRQAQDQEDFEEERGEGVTFGKRFDVVAQELLGLMSWRIRLRGSSSSWLGFDPLSFVWRRLSPVTGPTRQETHETVGRGSSLSLLARQCSPTCRATKSGSGPLVNRHKRAQASFLFLCMCSRLESGLRPWESSGTRGSWSRPDLAELLVDRTRSPYAP